MGINVLAYQEKDSESVQKETEVNYPRELTSDYFREQGNEPYYSEKRVVDLVLGFIGFLAYVLIYPLVALITKIWSRGPFLFKQDRIGLNGEIFQCYKFRTMHTVKKQEKNGRPVVTLKDDERIFTFGNFMRRYNIDELPQLMNVLKGEMSLVGPRPYHVKESLYWSEVFDDHYYRYAVHPGITGFAQARGYRGGTLNKNLMRIRLDNVNLREKKFSKAGPGYYVQNGLPYDYTRYKWALIWFFSV